VRIWRELGDKQHLAEALNDLGMSVDAQGDYATAGSELEESLALRRELQDTWGMAEALELLGHVAIDQGDLTVAHAHFAEYNVLVCRCHVCGMIMAEELDVEFTVAT
jgi:hypothetical protein